MNRTLPEPEAPLASNSPDTAQSRQNLAVNSNSSRLSPDMNLWLLRCCLAAAAAAIALSLSPFGLHGWSAAAVGLGLALVIFIIENRLKRSASPVLLGGAIGGTLGALAALLVSAVIARTSQLESTKSFFEYASLLAFGYTGVVLGSRKFGSLKTGSLNALFGLRPGAPSVHADGKLLDTSVLIDGRIADICEAHFLDGPLLVPQFVLHELQTIADSPDSLRRQRGRRGLEVLQRIQKLQSHEVRIIEDIPGQTGDVDRKLVELALRSHAKIVTNDFNLNKVASVQGITVLNINLLANALRPAVLPGEGMRVFILREGKEVNQGVAYLEDGTMVVVDGARRLINKTVDILVTSVHQTPAGKMIFGRIDDRHDTPPPLRQSAAAGRSARATEPGPDRPLYPDSSK
jgi:Integral membrane protein (PIN domain superfamily)